MKALGRSTETESYHGITVVVAQGLEDLGMESLTTATVAARKGQSWTLEAVLELVQDEEESLKLCYGIIQHAMATTAPEGPSTSAMLANWGDFLDHKEKLGPRLSIPPWINKSEYKTDPILTRLEALHTLVRLLQQRRLACAPPTRAEAPRDTDTSMALTSSAPSTTEEGEQDDAITSTLAKEQQDLFKQYAALIQVDYDRRKQLMDQRLAILQANLGIKDATKAEAVDTHENDTANTYSARLSDMLQRFSTPHSNSASIAHPHRLEVSRLEVSAVDRGGRLVDADSSRVSMPKWT
jgi:hypothetical protein